MIGCPVGHDRFAPPPPPSHLTSADISRGKKKKKNTTPNVPWQKKKLRGKVAKFSRNEGQKSQKRPRLNLRLSSSIGEWKFQVVFNGLFLWAWRGGPKIAKELRLLSQFGHAADIRPH